MASESEKISEEEAIWGAVEYLHPPTESERESCFTQIADIIDLYRQPDTKKQDEELSKQRHEIGELFLQIAEKMIDLSEEGEDRLCFLLNTELFRVEYVFGKGGLGTKEGQESRSYDDIIEIFRQLSIFLCYEYNERMEEYGTEKKKRGQKPKIWQKILLVKQCYWLFKSYRPGDAKQTSDDFPDFPQNIHFFFFTFFENIHFFSC